MVLHGALSTAYVSNELPSPTTVLALDESEPDTVKSLLRAMEEVDTLSEAQRASGVYDKYVAGVGMDRAGDSVYFVFRVLRGGGEGIGGRATDVTGALAAYDPAQLPRHHAGSPCLRQVCQLQTASSNQLATGIACQFFVYVDCIQNSTARSGTSWVRQRQLQPGAAAAAGPRCR